MKRERPTEDLASAARSPKRPKNNNKTALKLDTPNMDGSHCALLSVPATPASSVTLVGSPAPRPSSRPVSRSATTSLSDSDESSSDTSESDSAVDSTSESSSSSEDSENSDSRSTSGDSLPHADLCSRASLSVHRSLSLANCDSTPSSSEVRWSNGGAATPPRQDSTFTRRPVISEISSSELETSDSASGSGSESGSDGEMSSSSDSDSPSGPDSNSGQATGSASDASAESDSDSESESEADDKTPPFATPPPPYSLIDPHPSSLRSRLSSFLPSFAAANHTLEQERAAGTLGDHAIENVGSDDEQYIEMDLGLGVLEERRESCDRNSSGGEETDLESEPKEKDVLGTLLGKHRHRERPYIEPLGEV